MPTHREEDVDGKNGMGRSEGAGGSGEGERKTMRQTAVILLVILSGSQKTRALLKQLPEEKVRNKRTAFFSAPSWACYGPLP